MAACEDWTTETLLTTCGCPDELLNADAVAAAIDAASEWFHEKTQHRFGICTTTERPCRECSCGSPMMCSCEGGGLFVQTVHGPISGTPTVTIDGAAFSSFEVIQPNFLRRTDGLAWPSCNSFGSGDGTWTVTYDHGEAIPELGKLAAADLTIEILKSCQGKTCSLPAGTTSINRRGVSITLDKDKAGKALPRVAMFFDAYPVGSVRDILRVDQARGYVTSGPA